MATNPFQSLPIEDKERLRAYLDANTKEDLIDLVLEGMSQEVLAEGLERALEVEEENQVND